MAIAAELEYIKSMTCPQMIEHNKISGSYLDSTVREFAREKVSTCNEEFAVIVPSGSIQFDYEGMSKNEQLIYCEDVGAKWVMDGRCDPVE